MIPFCTCLARSYLKTMLCGSELGTIVHHCVKLLQLADNIEAATRTAVHLDASSGIDSCYGRMLLFVLDLLQRVPLCNGSARIGQHVAPVSQLSACRRAAESHAADWIRRPDAVIVNHSNHQRHFLQPATNGAPMLTLLRAT